MNSETSQNFEGMNPECEKINKEIPHFQEFEFI
jgi:hypothetical protein